KAECPPAPALSRPRYQGRQPPCLKATVSTPAARRRAAFPSRQSPGRPRPISRAASPIPPKRPPHPDPIGLCRTRTQRILQRNPRRKPAQMRCFHFLQMPGRRRAVKRSGPVDGPCSAGGGKTAEFPSPLFVGKRAAVEFHDPIRPRAAAGGHPILRTFGGKHPAASRFDDLFAASRSQERRPSRRGNL